MTACTMCRTRLSYDDGTHAHPHCRGAAPLTEAYGTHAHPHCRGAAPLTEAELARLVHALGDLLGARPLTPHQEPR